MSSDSGSTKTLCLNFYAGPGAGKSSTAKAISRVPKLDSLSSIHLLAHFAF